MDQYGRQNPTATLSSHGATSQGLDQSQWASLERMKAEASKVSASVGQNVVLNCAVQFKDGVERPFVVNWLKYPHKLPIYIWYAGYPPHVAQGYENRVSRIGQASLNLTEVRPTDQGLYECRLHFPSRTDHSRHSNSSQNRASTATATTNPADTRDGTWIYLDVQGKYLEDCLSS